MEDLGCDWYITSQRGDLSRGFNTKTLQGVVYDRVGWYNLGGTAQIRGCYKYRFDYGIRTEDGSFSFELPLVKVMDCVRYFVLMVKPLGKLVVITRSALSPFITINGKEVQVLWSTPLRLVDMQYDVGMGVYSFVFRDDRDHYLVQLCNSGGMLVRSLLQNYWDVRFAGCYDKDNYLDSLDWKPSMSVKLPEWGMRDFMFKFKGR